MISAKKEYGQKLYKICFDAGFSCPNRDGTLDTRGCIFCSKGGSGEFAVKIDSCLECDEEQISLAKEKVSKKYKGDKYIAYFQAFSNTYKDVESLRQLYLPIVKRDDIAVLSIATRPDCLNDETYALLQELNSIKPVWVELGLQTTKPETISYIRRGYDTAIYDNVISRLNEIGIHTITHIILFLPGETKQDMINTVTHAVNAGTKGLKLQQLYIIKETDLANDYYQNKDGKFHIPSLDEYIEILKECIDKCPDNMIFHRLTGDPDKRTLIEPQWAADKKNVINSINDALNPSGPWYVYMLECADGSFYTGSTNDVLKRFHNHATGKGCKYSATHLPVKLIYVEECPTKRAALSREYAIKQLRKNEKRNLLSNTNNLISEYYDFL